MSPFFCRLVFATTFGLLASGSHVLAAPLTLSLENSVITAINREAVFRGSIENNTGSSIAASDLFFNFFAFDPTVITSIDQLLGSPGFTLQTNENSGVIDLFKVTISTSTMTNSARLSFVLQDINNNLSAPLNAEIRTSPIPEPTSFILLIVGGMWLFISATKRNRSLFGRT